MTFTITMTDEEIDKVLDIASSIDKRTTNKALEDLTSGATYDFGGLVISSPESNVLNVDITPYFADFILTGTAMDIVSMIPMLKRFYNKFIKECSQHLRSPIVTKKEDADIDSVSDFNDDEDDIPDDDEDFGVNSKFNTFNNISKPDKISTDDYKTKPVHEYAIFNV